MAESTILSTIATLALQPGWFALGYDLLHGSENGTKHSNKIGLIYSCRCAAAGHQAKNSGEDDERSRKQEGSQERTRQDHEGKEGSKEDQERGKTATVTERIAGHQPSRMHR
jgi:hypothetical protein